MIAETAFLSRKKGALGKRSREEYWRRDMETGSTTAGAPEWQRHGCSYGAQGGAKKAAPRASAGGTGNEGSVTGVVMACRAGKEGSVTDVVMAPQGSLRFGAREAYGCAERAACALARAASSSTSTMYSPLMNRLSGAGHGRARFKIYSRRFGLAATASPSPASASRKSA